MQDPETMTPEARLDFIESIRQRVVTADSLREAGEDARADAAEPSADELNAAVDALRLIRASRATSAPKRGKAAPTAPTLSLADLLKPAG